MQTYTWELIPTGAVPVTRHCKTCGKPTAFASSGRFRINAQRKALDIWLIYRCTVCGGTWNATIYTRTRPQALPPGLLARFEANDEALAAQYAADAALLRRCGSEIGTIAYEIHGAEAPPSVPAALQIVNRLPVSVRLDAILRRGLGFSQRLFETALAQGQIFSPEGIDLRKARLPAGATMLIELR